jgi:hypothetical protein
VDAAAELLRLWLLLRGEGHRGHSRPTYMGTAVKTRWTATTRVLSQAGEEDHSLRLRHRWLNLHPPAECWNSDHESTSSSRLHLRLHTTSQDPGERWDKPSAKQCNLEPKEVPDTKPLGEQVRQHSPRGPHAGNTHTPRWTVAHSPLPQPHLALHQHRHQTLLQPHRE